MKKILLIMLVGFMSLSLVACGGDNGGGGEVNKSDKYDDLDDNSIYLVTDIGTIDDKSFNQGSWEGIKRFADEAGVKPNFLKPVEAATPAYLSSIADAIEAGAKVIVAPGHLFMEAIFKAQDLHPDTKFIVLDAAPALDFETDPVVKDNTLSIFYREEQSGFLAGYAAVYEGFTNVGFMGGQQSPAVVNFGYGFIKGVDYAAAELGVDANVRYTYLNSFAADPRFETQGSAWFTDGVELIFTAAGQAGNSLMAAAEKFDDKFVIGVDVDQKDESPKVITSAMKNLQGSIYEALKDVFEGNFKGGQIIVLGIDEDGVQLSDDFSRLNKFTVEDYNKITEKLKTDATLVDEIPSFNNTDSIDNIKLSNTKVQYIE